MRVKIEVGGKEVRGADGFGMLHIPEGEQIKFEMRIPSLLGMKKGDVRTFKLYVDETRYFEMEGRIKEIDEESMEVEVVKPVVWRG